MRHERRASRRRHGCSTISSADFPLEPRPYARLADALGIEEHDVLAMLADLKADGKIARVGAIVRPNSIGASTLGRDADQGRSAGRRGGCRQPPAGGESLLPAGARDQSLVRRHRRGSGRGIARSRCRSPRKRVKRCSTCRSSSLTTSIWASICDAGNRYRPPYPRRDRERVAADPTPIPGHGRAARHLRRGVDRAFAGAARRVE